VNIRYDELDDMFTEK